MFPGNIVGNFEKVTKSRKLNKKIYALVESYNIGKTRWYTHRYTHK